MSVAHIRFAPAGISKHTKTFIILKNGSLLSQAREAVKEQEKGGDLLEQASRNSLEWRRINYIHAISLINLWNLLVRLEHFYRTDHELAGVRCEGRFP